MAKKSSIKAAKRGPEDAPEPIPVPTQVLSAGTVVLLGGLPVELTEDSPITFNGASDEAKFAGMLQVSGEANFQLNAPSLKGRYSPVHGGAIPNECDNCGRAIPAENKDQVTCSAECARALDGRG